MTMNIMAIILMIPFTARNDGFWMLICGRESIPAIRARTPTISVVMAVKFLSPSLFRILFISSIGLDSAMKPRPRIPSHRASMY